MALTQLRDRIRKGVSRQPTDADMRQAREAMMIALGKAVQPSFVGKSHARWESIKSRYGAAADRLDQTGKDDDRKLASELRQFLRDRATIETVPDKVLRDAERRIRAEKERGDNRAGPDPGVPRRTVPPSSRTR